MTKRRLNPLSIPLAALFLAGMVFGANAQDYATKLRDGIAAYREGQFAKAMTMLEPFARGGEAEASLLVGTMYELGQGTVQDYRAAERYLRSAADANNAKAQIRLAFLYADGKLGQARAGEAADLFERAAMTGDATAQINLAVIYSIGFGRPQNDMRAHVWANLAAANGQQKAIELRQSVETRLSPDTLLAAQELARKCLASRYSDCRFDAAN